MNKAALIESLMSTFVEEVAEHVRSFNRDLLALESGQGDPAGLLQSLFRTAHNLKGAARAVDVALVESACHGLEDILARARDGERPLDAEAFAILFATADAIQDAGARLKEKQSLAASPLAALISRLMAAPGAAARPVPASASRGSTSRRRDGPRPSDARPPRRRHPPGRARASSTPCWPAAASCCWPFDRRRGAATNGRPSRTPPRGWRRTSAACRRSSPPALPPRRGPPSSRSERASTS